MNNPIFCPSCGGDMYSWQESIYECEGCGVMADIGVIEEEEEIE